MNESDKSPSAMLKQVDLLRMAKVAGKATKGGLTPEQSERARTAIKDRLLPRYGGNVSALAKALGAQQPSVFRFLYRGTGTSIQVAAAAAELLGEDLYDVIGLAKPLRTVETDDDQPYRPEAIDILRRLGVDAGAIERLRKNPGARSGEPQTLRFLVELGLFYERQGPRTGRAIDEAPDADLPPIAKEPPTEPPKPRPRAPSPRKPK